MISLIVDTLYEYAALIRADDPYSQKAVELEKFADLLQHNAKAAPHDQS